MTKIIPRRPSGFVEYLPDEQIEFNRLLAIIRETYEKYGFAPIDTPGIELSEVLLAKGGGETEQEIYRFTRGKNDLSLRFDLTVPLARYVAEHEDKLAFPFRRYHIGKVHRAERAQAGRFREFYQCDIDIIGSNSPVIDAEFPAIINEIFSRFNFGEFTIRINDRRILNGFLEAIGLRHASSSVLRIIDKMEKISHEEFRSELAGAGLSQQQITQVLDFTAITGTNNEILSKLKTLDPAAEQLQCGIAKLEQLVANLRVMNMPESRFKIDLKIARGLDYYTGTVYETVLNDYPGLGSVCSGGRYDNLASHYTNTILPGVGVSIGLSRLFYKLLEAGVITPLLQSPASVVVMPLDMTQIPSGITVAALLRANTIATVLYTEQNTLKKKLRYADRMGFEYTVLIGASEAAADSVTIKNMRSGIAKTLRKDDLSAYISTNR